LFEGSESAGHDRQDKPFAVWPLRPDPQDQMWTFCAAWLPGGPPPAGVIAPEEVRLGAVGCQVAEITHRSVTRAALTAAPPTGSAQLTFCSPTYFSQNGTDVVMPDPRLIAGSWRRRWNATLAEGDLLRIDDGAWRETHRAIALTAFDLRTQRMDSGRAYERPGFTGTATLRLGRDTPAPAGLFSAPWCGSPSSAGQGRRPPTGSPRPGSACRPGSSRG
jgi:hypothetical protein